nr:helix-turn-helix transcriptional regulator [Bacillus infantis]
MVNGYSLRSLAVKLGVSSPYLSQIINEKRNPSAKVAKKITEHFDKEFHDFFYIESGHKSKQKEAK